MATSWSKVALDACHAHPNVHSVGLTHPGYRPQLPPGLRVCAERSEHCTDIASHLLRVSTLSLWSHITTLLDQRGGFGGVSRKCSEWGCEDFRRTIWLLSLGDVGTCMNTPTGSREAGPTDLHCQVSRAHLSEPSQVKFDKPVAR